MNNVTGARIRNTLYFVVWSSCKEVLVHDMNLLNEKRTVAEMLRKSKAVCIVLSVRKRVMFVENKFLWRYGRNEVISVEAPFFGRVLTYFHVDFFGVYTKGSVIYRGDEWGRLRGGRNEYGGVLVVTVLITVAVHERSLQTNFSIFGHYLQLHLLQTMII